MKKYDSTQDTLDHIGTVQKVLGIFIQNLGKRGIVHDKSKLRSPEKELFDEYTPKLKKLTYGSEEYKESLTALKPALDHHYSVNSHHPEHYENGIDGMDLLDLIEMLSDWKAATMRHEDGDIIKSLEVNRERFKMSDQLYNIFKNTVTRYLK